MVTKSFFFGLCTKIKFIFLIFFLASCINTEKRAEVDSSQAEAKAKDAGVEWSTVKGAGENEKQVEPVSEASNFPGKVELKTFENVKVGIIIGPGGALSASGLGFIKAIKEAKADIRAIAGVGWGSLVGALYAKDATVSSVEWSLYKLFNQELYSSSFFKLRKSDFNYSRVSNHLGEVFTNKTLESLAVPFACTSQTINSAVSYMEVQGNAKKAVESCLYYPPFSKPGQSVISSPYSVDRLIKWVKKQGAQYIIVINPMGNRAFLSSQSLNRMSYSEKLMWKELYDFYKRLKTVSPNLIKDVPVNWVDINSSGHSLFSFVKWKQIMEDGYIAGRDLSRQMGL